MMKLFITVMVTLFFHVISGNSLAEQWSVAVVQDFPPYAYVENGEVKGIHTDIAGSVLDRMQVDYEMVGYPWKRVVHMTDKAQVIFSLTWVEKPERFKKYLMVGPIQGGRTVFSVRNDSDIKYEKLTDLQGYKIGTIAGYAYPKAFENSAFLDKDPATISNEALIKKLLGKRVDVIIGDENVLRFEAKRMGVSNQIKFLPKSLKIVFRYAAFPKVYKEQAIKFTKALNAFKADEELYQSVIDKYR